MVKNLERGFLKNQVFLNEKTSIFFLNCVFYRENEYFFKKIECFKEKKSILEKLCVFKEKNEYFQKKIEYF